jgi:hypothetical protein
MSGDLRALAEKYVAHDGEIDDVRREMLACLTNGGRANPVARLQPRGGASQRRSIPMPPSRRRSTRR